MYEYGRALDANFTEDFPIASVVVSLKNMEIYIAAGRSVSVWSLEEGIQLQTFGNIMKASITGMALDGDQRRLYISDQSGQIG